MDLLDREAVELVLGRCTHVVNCSRGGEEVMLKGLSNLLNASRSAGIDRFVHLSSVTVYGDPPDPASEFESGPTVPAKRTYGWMKLRQDELVASYARKGLSSVVLAAPNISGPYSYFLLGVLHALRHHRLRLLAAGSAPCVLVDVSNLAFAIELVLDKGGSEATRYFVTDDSRTTWQNVIEGLAPLNSNAELPPEISRGELEAAGRSANRPQQASPLHAIMHLVSSDVRAALRKDPLWLKADQLVRRTVAALGNRVEDKLRLSIEGPLHPPDRAHEQQYDVRLSAQQLRNVFHSCDRARRELGYHPLVSFTESMSAFVR